MDTFLDEDRMKYNVRNYIYFLLFLAIGLWIFLFGGYLSTLTVGIRTTIKVFNPLVLGTAALVCSRQERWKVYFPVVFAYFLGASGLLLAWFFREWPLVVLVEDMNTPGSWAIAKLFEALPMILPALVLLPLVKMSCADVYFHRGRLGLSLLLGLGMCILIWSVYGLTSDVFPKLRSILPVLGWVILFSVTNAFMEEFMLRGLFLRPFENFFSPGSSWECRKS